MLCPSYIYYSSSIVQIMLCPLYIYYIHLLKAQQWIINIVMLGNFKVVARVRPLTSLEEQQMLRYSQFPNSRLKLSAQAYAFYAKYYKTSIHEVMKFSAQNILVYDSEYKGSDYRQFDFSRVHLPPQNNHSIFTCTFQKEVQAVLHGYNCTIMAYGITGSGKTHSVFGTTNRMEYGLCYLSFRHLLHHSDPSTKYSLTFIEIYNENVRDLLSESKKSLQLSEDATGVQLPQASRVEISTLQQLQTLIQAGTKKRISAATTSNQLSSRSHGLISLTVTTALTTARLLVIDLAGSEKTQSKVSIQRQQGANINRSLHALGNCINALTSGKESQHVPYRDSKLTRLLKDSLSGNTKTIMLACLTSFPFCIEETLSTLHYAERAQGIKKELIRNCQPLQKCTCDKAKINTLRSQPIQQYISNPSKQILIDIYQQIVQNAKEEQQIINLLHQYGDQGQDILKKNQEEKHILKELLFAAFKNNNFEKKKIQIYHSKEKNKKQTIREPLKEINQNKIDKIPLAQKETQKNVIIQSKYISSSQQLLSKQDTQRKQTQSNVRRRSRSKMQYFRKSSRGQHNSESKQ